MKRKSLFVLSVLVTLILTALVVSTASASTGCFTDTNGHIFETFICWMKDNGITSGTAPGLYSPEAFVTRGQMAVFMERTDELAVSQAKAYTDLSNRGTGKQIDIVLGSGVAANTSGAFASVTITAPTQGALLVNGSLNLFCTFGLFGSCVASNGNTYINVDGTRYNRQYYSIDGGSSSVNGAAWNSSNTAYVPVAAGAHTVYIEVVNSSGSAGSTGVWSGGINVLFVQFAGDGTPPALIDPGVSPESADGPGAQGN